MRQRALLRGEQLQVHHAGVRRNGMTSELRIDQEIMRAEIVDIVRTKALAEFGLADKERGAKCGNASAVGGGSGAGRNSKRT